MSAADVSKSSSSTADSYIGSLISLTSKSDIRYEGILYNINTEESSIGLRNVRSFGSEGRKKDGAQVLPSDKVYEYILFRGSDIKDLQVKTSTTGTAPPVQPAQPINNDPAIIQSNYPRPGPTPSNLQVGPTGPGFQGGMPLYQPNVNTSGLAMPPMYWPGYYAPPNGLPHQQSLYQPTPMQYPGFASSLPGGPPNLSNSLLGSTLPSGLPPVPALLTSSEPLPSFMQTKVSSSVGPTTLPPVSLTTSITTSLDPSATVPLVSSKSNGLSGAPSLVTPDQLLQAGAQVVHKEVKPVVPQAPKPIPSYEQSTPALVPKPTLSPEPSASPLKPSPLSFEPSAPALAPKPAPLSEPSAAVVGSTETQPPILPLPTQTSDPPKTNGGQYQNRNSYRGRDRGRGSGGPRSVINFTEEFDFTAMNEKFNKDEVWGTLGKNNKIYPNGSDEYDYEDENDTSDLPKNDVKPVYSKDDFFDTLSCNNDGRTRFSEQMKLDTETFGEFSRYRGGGRGGRGPNWGGRYRGGGYHGRGYGYANRARGGRNPARDY